MCVNETDLSTRMTESALESRKVEERTTREREKERERERERERSTRDEDEKNGQKESVAFFSFCKSQSSGSRLIQRGRGTSLA